MKISVVVVEYHSLEELKKCTETIQTAFSWEVEIIASSNSCYPPTEQERIKKEYNQFVWSFNDRNGGFAYAMNQGLKIATGDYLIIANPDCVFLEKMDKMVTFIDSHPEVGAIAPQIVDSDGVLQDTCRSYVSVQSFIWRQIRRIVTHRECILERSFDYNKVQTVDWVIGAFIMVRRTVYESTCGLSEDYFMYSEDQDWCTRIRLAGWEIVYYPKVKIQYKGTRSARTNRFSAKVFLKSANIFWRKYGYFRGYPQRKKIIYEDIEEGCFV